MMNNIYIGTYTDTGSKGIYIAELDEHGGLRMKGYESHEQNPSYLTLSPNRKFLYVVSECASYSGVTAYAVDEAQAQLTMINKRTYAGADTCYLSTSLDGNFLFAANYGSGSVLSIKIDSDGSVGDVVSEIKHTGSSVHPQRQQSAYAHCIIPDKQNKSVLVADLGTDSIYTYSFDSQTGQLAPKNQTKTPQGAGPRHLVFDESGQYLYVVTELSNQFLKYSYDSVSGALTQLCEHNILQSDFSGESTGADIHISPNGEFLYASNRGEDSIACFSLKNNDVTYMGSTDVDKTPRNFGITPDGRILLCAGLQSNSLTAYSLDSTTGKIGHALSSIEVPAPSCIKIV